MPKASLLASLLLWASLAALAQTTRDPFPAPIALTEGAVVVGLTAFARLPDSNGQAARMMLLVDEPGTGRLFASDMNGLLYTVGYDGTTVRMYLDLRAPGSNVNVESAGLERGFQSFAFHPQFSQRGTRGFGRFYTYVDTRDIARTPDFLPRRDTVTHDTVLLEWTARNPSAAVYDGGPPRELLRLRQPFENHNGGQIAFNLLAKPGEADYGLLYVGVADGGGAGDPLGHAQNLGVAFGKILRLDPLGNTSGNRQYGIPATNPFAADPSGNVLREIYAYGVRNPQRFGWDRQTGNLFLADIGQGVIEEISLVRPGANLGWNEWEGSFRSRGADVELDGRRGDSTITYPVVEYAHRDQLLLGRSAITGVVAYRGIGIPQLANLLLFGDNPSGEVFYVNADQLPSGGQDAIRRVLFRDGTQPPKTLLQVVRDGTPGALRVDLRFGTGPADRVFLLNKSDGVIREIVP